MLLDFDPLWGGGVHKKIYQITREHRSLHQKHMQYIHNLLGESKEVIKIFFMAGRRGEGPRIAQFSNLIVNLLAINFPSEMVVCLQ